MQRLRFRPTPRLLRLQAPRRVSAVSRKSARVEERRSRRLETGATEFTTYTADDQITMELAEPSFRRLPLDSKGNSYCIVYRIYNLGALKCTQKAI